MIGITVILPTLIVLATAACPPQCGCYDDGRVVCHGVDSIPSNIPERTVRHLDVSGGGVSSLGGRVSGYASLVTLNVSRNRLASLDWHDLEGLSHLLILDLSRNRLVTLTGPTDPFLVRDLHLDHNELTSSALRLPRSLIELTASNNKLRSAPDDLPDTLLRLDLSYNNLTTLDNITGQSLRHLDLRGNRIHMIMNGALSSLRYLDSLDLTNNDLTSFSGKPFLGLTKLSLLNLENNELININSADFSGLGNLRSLYMKGNRLTTVRRKLFVKTPMLERLDLSDLADLRSLHGDALSGLDRLVSLNLSHNRNLTFVPTSLFLPLSGVRRIDLSWDSLQSLYERSVDRLTALSDLRLEGNPLMCDCSVGWLKDWYTNQSSVVRPVTCSDPVSLRGQSVRDVPRTQFNCTAIVITNYTESVFKAIGSETTLRCQATGQPEPSIAWFAPSGRVYKHESYARPTHRVADEATNASHQRHRQHPEYRDNTDMKDRVHLLSNGDLHIAYVLRTDAGSYYCRAHSPGGNATVKVQFLLDYLVLNRILLTGMTFGGLGAAGVLVLTMLGCCVKACVGRCVKQKRIAKSRVTIRNIFDNLEAYKTTRMDKLRENYHHQISKIRGQCSQRLDKLRDNYHSQVSKIKGNCSQQMQKVRDNYQSRVGKVKDYSSTKMVNIRDNYQLQKSRIREYGSLQLRKLHDNYKAQQQYLLKLLEMMNIDNCKTVGSDCEDDDTESVLLNGIVIDTPPLQAKRTKDDDLGSDDFVTASESSSLAAPEDGDLTTFELSSLTAANITEDEDSVLIDSPALQHVIEDSPQPHERLHSLAIDPHVVIIQTDTMSDGDTSSCQTLGDETAV